MNAAVKTESRSEMTSNRTAYDQFLGAVICEEDNGMPLTIVSALSRAGVDPLREATRLTGLRRQMAADSLAEALSRANVTVMSRAELDGAAARLVQLLPERQATSARAPRRLSFATAGIHWQGAAVAAVILAAAIYVWL